MKQYSAFSNQHSARNLTIIVMVVLSLFSATAFAFAADILEQDLQSRYKDKVVMLRNFYCGDKLHFDAQGNLLSGGSTGPWTLCRDIRIKDVKVKDGKVTLKGERIYLSYDYRQKRFRNASEVWQQKKHEHKGDKVSIEIALQPNPEEALAQDAVSRLFYSSQEEFSKTMPRLWRGCLAGNLDQQTKSVSKAEPAHNSSESFIQEDHSNQSGQSSQPVASNSGGILHVGKGVTAPQPIFTPDPDYSDAARSVLFQGTVVLSAIISPDGQVQNPALVRCAGLGLDERSIEKVLSWKFKPATKDGKPVAVEVSVEVSFRLY
jgi:TonB family protein